MRRPFNRATLTPLREMLREDALALLAIPVGFPLLFSSEMRLLDLAIAFLHEHAIQRVYTAETAFAFVISKCTAEAANLPELRTVQLEFQMTSQEHVMKLVLAIEGSVGLSET